MNNPKITAVANQIKQILEAQAGLELVIRNLLAEEDLSSVSEQLAKELDGPFVKTLTTIANRAVATEQTINGFNAAMHYRKLEVVHGKGTWRSWADNGTSSNPTVHAIVSLRQSHDMSLREAKQTIMAYQAKLFE